MMKKNFSNFTIVKKRASKVEVNCQAIEPPSYHSKKSKPLLEMMRHRSNLPLM